ncbi:GAP family protein [Mycobacterium sp. SM1]|uniref:GAP family protein n=1 Tax=Mycobacterium sp. SM1 TaxID=2816243 RepID=UPI001BCCE8C1|nr:GAP family protein [Mycobacterium sp. SM1]MBS4726890.1 GAP family protein [Mycobacterium sp. SM1]
MGAVLAMALIAAANPVRLGVALLLISRPRPLLNLLAFWLGAMATGITAGLSLLIAMHDFGPAAMQSLSALAARPAARRAHIAIGMAVLSLAVLVAVGFSVRRAPLTGGGAVARVPRASTPSLVSRLLGRAQGVLQGKSLWPAFVVGLSSGFPAVEYPMALAVIAASGGAIGTQLSTVIMFVVVMLAVIELPLLSYPARPEQTQAALMRLHGWVRPRRRRILALSLGAAAVAIMATGMG